MSVPVGAPAASAAPTTGAPAGAEAGAAVRQEPALIGRWKFNQASGNPLSSPDEGPAGAAAVLGAGARVNPDDGLLPVLGILQLDGTATGYAEAAATPLHTDRSFSLAAWANTTGLPTQDMTVLSQGTGTNSSVLVRWHYLGLDDHGSVIGEWQATVADGDGPDATRTTVAHTMAYSVLENWTHLALVYDASEARLTLYVNGRLENQTCEPGQSDCVPHVSWAGGVHPFDAGSGLEFGRARVNGGWGEHFAGSLDDVWVFQGALREAQINKLSNYGAELDTSVGV